MQETRVQSLGWEHPLEKGMAIHSSILAWTIPCTEEPGRLQSTGLQRVRHSSATNTHTLSKSFLTTLEVVVKSPLSQMEYTWHLISTQYTDKVDPMKYTFRRINLAL